MKDTGLVIIGAVALLMLYFYTEKNQQSVQANTSGLNNSFPTFNMLYPIGGTTFGGYTYSGNVGGLPTMVEQPPSYNYYGGNSAGGIYSYPQSPGYQNYGQVGTFLGSMFGG